MASQIRHIEIANVSLVPAQAELRLTVELDQINPTTEIRGRLMGPRCQFSSTVEIAYPLRPLAQTDPLRLSARVLVPEASLWDPVSPFLYAGPLELWQDGQRLEQRWIQHGMRSLTIGSRGLRINGRPLRLRGRAVDSVTEEHLLSLRTAGINLLVVNRGEDEELMNLADRLGFMVLYQPPPSSPEMQQHPSSLNIDLQIVPADIAARTAATGATVLAHGVIESETPTIIGCFD